jgi:hypothetical protein
VRPLAAGRHAMVTAASKPCLWAKHGMALMALGPMGSLADLFLLLLERTIFRFRLQFAAIEPLDFRYPGVLTG